MELFFKLTPETSFLEDFEEKKNYFKFKFPGAEKSGEQVCSMLYNAVTRLVTIVEHI